MKTNKKPSKKSVGITMNASGLRSLRHAVRGVSESAGAWATVDSARPRRR
jgi:hypothetical protein